MLVMYLTRGTPIKEIRLTKAGVDVAEVTSPLFHITVKLLTSTPLYRHNRIDLLLNGDETYGRLWEDLQAAREVVIVHVFFYKPGRLAERMREVLSGRARAGVQVFFYSMLSGLGDYKRSMCRI
jgi:phosphatidylserine/phosphatidylglycerophosphate/cardiolipin synthase-like enzyme